MSIIRATPSGILGFTALRFPYSDVMLKVLKKYPGCRWDGPRHSWLVPNELAEGLVEFAETALKWEAAYPNVAPLQLPPIKICKEAYAYQREDVTTSLEMKRSMLAWEMGLGKTLGGCELMRHSECKRFLVVCPAMARSVWEGKDGLSKWWPDHPQVATIRDGKAAASFALEYGGDDSWICIISYELLKKLMLPPGLEMVIADESHYVKEAKVGRSKALREILTKWQVEYRYFLTGTPITINPIDIHNQADLLYPGRLGNYHQFGDAYCGRVANGYRYRGYDYQGVNPARAQELEQRLASFVLRRTKSEVANQLPKLIPATIRLPPDNSIQKKIEAALKSGQGLAEILAKNLDSKLEAILALTEEDFATGTTHACLATYHQADADRLAGALEDAIGGWSGNRPIVFHVDGKTPEKKRAAIIAQAKEQPFAILVATMKATSVGISLTKFSPATCCELYSAPGIVSQWAGRFHRIGGENDTAVIRFVVREGSDEERIASVLARRIKEQDKAIKKGQIDAAVVNALEAGDEDDPAAMLSRLRDAFADSREEDAYA